MKLYKRLLFLCCWAAVLPASAEVNFNGFLSVSGGMLLDDDEIPTYAGYDEDWNTDPDTTFALQASADLSDKITATGQLIARGEDDYDLEAEWAYLTYAATSNVDIRVGRLRSPFFIYSDFLDVGYAYPWIRPPEQTYRFLFTTVEGVDTVITGSLGDWDSTFQAYYGRLTDESGLGGERVDLDLKGFTGANWTLSKDWFTVRATYNQAEYTIGLPSTLSNAAGTGLLDLLTAAGFAGVADALNPNEEDAQFYGIGINIDHNDWLLVSEYTVLDVDDQNAVSDDDALYVMVGRRFGDFTAHITWDRQEADPDLDIFNVIPDGVAPALDALKAGALSAVADPRDERTDITVGLRYDFTPGAAFKVEVTDLDREPGGRDGTLVSFAVDMVF
ncbi:MAG: porin [Pseudomonadales bacterium]